MLGGREGATVRGGRGCFAVVWRSQRRCCAVGQSAALDCSLELGMGIVSDIQPDIQRPRSDVLAPCTGISMADSYKYRCTMMQERR